MAEPTPSQLGAPMTLSGSPIPRPTLELPDYEHLRNRDYTGHQTRYARLTPELTAAEEHAAIRASAVPVGEVDRSLRSAVDALQATRRAPAKANDSDLARTVERLAADMAELLGKVTQLTGELVELRAVVDATASYDGTAS